MNIINMYEDLKKYICENEERDDLFYDAPEGEAQVNIVREMLEEILHLLS